MSAQSQWHAIDALIEGTLLDHDPALEACLSRSREAGLPDIAVSAAQGKFLAMFAMAAGAKRILEIGTLGGYSAIWLARGAGPDGRVVTLELDAHYAEVARANIAGAGLANRVDVIVGPALGTLDGVRGPIDMAFIDANKANNILYVDNALRLVKTGGIIIVDNVVRAGQILDPNADEAARATRALHDHVAATPRLDATALQTVGSKGWDGILIARVL